MTGPSDARIAETILRLAQARGPEKSICPSEAARALAPEPQDAWRALMPAVRRAADELARAGLLRATQKGADVSPLEARGPIRLSIAAGQSEG